MAGTTSNVLVGAASTVKFGAYVSDHAPATLSDVGFTMGGVMFDPTVELHAVEVDQYLGTLAALPKKRDVEVKMKLAEATIENLRLALAQPTGNVTGTAPNETIYYDGSAVAQYYQIEIVGPGLGTNSTRTITMWKAYIKDVAAITMQKDAEQALDLTLGLCEDVTSVTNPDSFMTIVDS